MKGTGNSLLLRSLSKIHLPSTKAPTPTPIRAFVGFKPFSTTAANGNEKEQRPSKPNGDSLLLEKFRQRKLQGSSKSPQAKAKAKPSPKPSSSGWNAETRSGSEVNLEHDERNGATEVVSSFEELGLRKELIGAAAEMGVCVPSEIQCVGIPSILEGKSLVLSSDSGSGRTLAYMLPLVQLLRQDGSGMKPKHPRAVVLCTTEELSDQCFQMAKFINHHAQLKATKTDSDQGQDVSNAPIGMLVGTPSEVLEHMEEGNMVPDNIKYLVLDDVDVMLDRGFGSDISKIVSPLKNCALKSHDQGFQTVLVASTITKILSDKSSPLMDHIEHNHSGKVTAMLLEMDQAEVFELIESLDALKNKMAEAMGSLNLDASGS